MCMRCKDFLETWLMFEVPAFTLANYVNCYIS